MVALVAVAAVVVAVRLGPSGPGEAADDPVVRVVGAATDGWQTLEAELPGNRRDETVRVLVDVPGEWAPIDADPDSVCGYYSYGADPDDCGENEVVAVYGNLVSDYHFGSGLRPAEDYDTPIESDWIGHVSVGGIDVSVSSDDRDLALRVLGSARLAGDEIPDLTGAWTDVEVDAISYPVPTTVPEGLHVDVKDRSGPRRSAEGEQAGPGRWHAVATVGRSNVVAVAPTRALAELVAGSARKVTTAWSTVEAAPGVVVDLPPAWARVAGGCGDGAVRFGASGTRGCDGPGIEVRSGDSVDASTPAGLDGGEGLVRSGDVVVSAVGLPHEVAQQVLGSVRATDDPFPGSPLGWAATEVGSPNDHVEQPQRADVRVDSVADDCDDGQEAGARTAATRDGDGWLATACGGDAYEVRAPTQALADLVAASLRPA
ncbi:hypothetical protein [Nocardioides sp. 1609]|uniref:hypothetical protein n=1 Tax=Nocardioides sp. 1609 TaxID=2508327 RepID=UPI00106FB4E0|nr:hypothetical protein [Nocardioides sp. 1609]